MARDGRVPISSSTTSKPMPLPAAACAHSPPASATCRCLSKMASHSSRLAGPQLHRAIGVTSGSACSSACSIRVRGVVQGVGFRPFVYRLARANTLAGWVCNGEEGVEIFLEGAEQSLRGICRDSERSRRPPPHRGNRGPIRRAAGPERIHHSREPAPRPPHGAHLARSCRLRRVPERTLRSRRPPLLVSLYQLHQLRPALHRGARPALRPAQYHHEDWPLDDYCAANIDDPENRRFHAQPVACPACGPGYYLRPADEAVRRERTEHPPALRELLSAGVSSR